MTNKNKIPSSKEFEHVLRAEVLSESQIRGLQILYSFPNHSATAPQLAKALGYKEGPGGANSVIGAAGRNIANALEIEPPWSNKQRSNWFSVIADAKDTDIGCLWVMRPTLVSALEKTKIVNPVKRNDAQTYLFITSPDYNPNKVQNRKKSWWSCSKSTRRGDNVLVYVGGEGIRYEWRASKDAKPDKKWKYICDVEFVRTIEPPITLKELRETFSKKEWGPPHQNFRGLRSIVVPDRILRQLSEMRGVGLRRLTDIGAEFNDDISKSLTFSSEERKKRLSTAPKKPVSAEVITKVFIRNPDVVAEVLVRANGWCESCGNPAPFKRSSDGTPYLEVHHKVKLADGGDDTVDNALALCPNCHREAHYG